MEEKMLKKDRAHTRYYVTDEETGKKVRVPGVTTITGVLAKPALKYWANKIGLQGIDINSYVDTRANMGTCAHDMVEAFLLGQKPSLDEFSKVEIDVAENSVLSFFTAVDGVEYQVLDVEKQLVSDAFRYGGTCDIYWIYEGKYRLTDIKTGKAIYPDMWTQVAGYWNLLIENGYPVDEVSIVNIPRAEDEQFKHEVISHNNLMLQWERFKLCREIYQNAKVLGINSW